MDAVLYHGEPNGPSLSVLAALEETGLAIECAPMDLAGGARHLLLHDRGESDDPVGANALGVIEPMAADYSVEGEGPVLLVGGEAMADSVFIAQYFDEAAGGGKLQPADPYARWQMRMWCRQATERLAPAVAWLGNLAFTQARLRAMAEEDFAALSATIRSEDLRARWQVLRDGAADDDTTTDSKAKVAQFVERVENKLADGREWLMGEFSIADLETFAWLRPMRTLEAGAFEGKDKSVDWMKRLGMRPSVQAALARATRDAPENAFAPGPEINRWG